MSSSPPGSTLNDTAMFPFGLPVRPPDVAVANDDRRATPAPAPAPWIAEALGGAAEPEVTVIELRPGDQVPTTRYVIERWIGDGGMGVVYEARHVDIERRVALKVLRHEFCRKPTVTKHFREEARLVSLIGSDHIADVSDFAELPDGRLLFVMELLQGGTVARELHQGPMEPARVIAIMRQVCKALAAAHAKHVVHRDLKPDNIALVEHKGRRDFVKVLDFGIAIVMSEADVATHAAAGTPSYLAPEVIIGQKVDARIDIYAAGCTAYEMLCGQPPFTGDGIEAVLRAHLDQKPVPPHQRRPEIHPALSKVVMRCLAKHKDDRYPSMIELEAALCEAQIEAKLQTTWDDLPIPDVDPARRVELLRQMPDMQGRPRPGTSRRWLYAAAAAIVLLAAVAIWAVMNRDRGLATNRGPIEALALAAYEAAAHSYFVYPPPDAPDEPTAFSKVVELESKSVELGAAAYEQAQRLRHEFADTLVRLGDEYWEREGGQPFAIDYYAEALVFTPDNSHAASRAILTPGQLALLRQKAETSSFSQAELVAAEPLIALAESDPAKREEKVAKLRSAPRARASTTEESLAKLASAPTRARAKKPSAPTVVAAEPSPSPSVAAPPADIVPTEAVATPTDAPTLPTGRDRDPAAASALVAEGNRARDSGRLSEARKAFERALALDGKSHAAMIGLSDVAFHSGDYARASTYAKKAVRMAPKSAEYRIRLGDAYFKLYRYEDAKHEYVEAQKLGSAAATARIAKVDAKLQP
ncbi:MAG TPA: serine/threonine-protein kinase [Nannocystaceae bacterium]|nr:serine/threonine-protein kinase [Nannocystaceae bacterium]